MLGMYLTTAVNFLATDTPTISGGMDSIWSGLGQAMMKVKDACLCCVTTINDLFRWCLNYFNSIWNLSNY